jgi:hypothetical protein
MNATDAVAAARPPHQEHALCVASVRIRESGRLLLMPMTTIATALGLFRKFVRVVELHPDAQFAAVADAQCTSSRSQSSALCCSAPAHSETSNTLPTATGAAASASPTPAADGSAAPPPQSAQLRPSFFLTGAACLFLAGKAVEGGRSARDVLNCAHHVFLPTLPPLDISERYHRLRERMLAREQVVLRALGFHLYVPHPYVHVLQVRMRCFVAVG